MPPVEIPSLAGNPFGLGVDNDGVTKIYVEIPSLAGNPFGRVQMRRRGRGNSVEIPSLAGNPFGPRGKEGTDEYHIVEIPSLAGNPFGLDLSDNDSVDNQGRNTLSGGQPLRTSRARKATGRNS